MPRDVARGGSARSTTLLNVLVLTGMENAKITFVLTCAYCLATIVSGRRASE